MIWIPACLLSTGQILHKAEELCSSGNIDAALALTERVLDRLERRSHRRRISQRHRTALALARRIRGKTLFEADREPEGFEEILRAHELEGSDWETLCLLVSSLLNIGDWRPVVRQTYLDYLEQSLHEEDPNFSANLRRMQQLSAPSRVAPSKHESVRHWNEKILSVRRDVAWAHRHLGQIALSSGDYNQAVESLSQAAQLESDRSAQLYLAYALGMQNQLKSAEDRLDEVIREEPSRCALLLRAHVLRRLGAATEAARDFACAGRQGRLTVEESLAYAECLLNSEDTEAATIILASLSAQNDPRYLVLAALADHAAGRSEDALRTVSQIAPSAAVLHFAGPRIVGIVARCLHAPDAINVLDLVPAEVRDNTYWIVRGNVFLDRQQLKEAIECWVKVGGDPTVQVQIRAATRHLLSSMYREGDDKGIIDLARRRPGAQTDRASEQIVTAALLRYFDRVSSREDADWCRVADEVEAIERQLAHPNDTVRLIRGLVCSELGEHDVALEILEALAKQTDRPEVWLQLARTALTAGDMETFDEASSHFDTAGERAARILAARMVIGGDWAGASNVLQHVPCTPTERAIRLDIDALAGIRCEAEQSTGMEQELAYFRMMGLLGNGHLEAAERVAAEVQLCDRWRHAAEKAWGWVALQEACQALRKGDEGSFLRELQEATRQWPDEDGPLPVMRLASGAFLGFWLASDRRDMVAAALDSDAAAAGPADPATCQNLAMYHLAEGSRLAAAGRWSDARTHWERAVSFVCVPLSNIGYLSDWARRRGLVYGKEPDGEAVVGIEHRVVTVFEETFHTHAHRLALKDCAESNRIADLAIVLQAELAAAKKLRELGGLDGGDGVHGRVSAGPMFLTLRRLEDRLAGLMKQLNARATNRPAHTSERIHSVDAAGTVELLRLFSPVRIAWVLHQSGHSTAAIDRITTLLASLKHRSTHDAGILDAMACNPAFANEDQWERYQELVGSTCVSMLVDAGVLAVSSRESKIEAALDHWMEAMAVAESMGVEAATTERIRRIALGRSRVLFQQDRVESGMELLEGVSVFCDDREIRCQLALQYANRGVEAAKDDRFKDALVDLEKARELDEISPHIAFHLATFLALRAREVFEDDRERAVSMLHRAAGLAAECVERDPHHKQMIELAKFVRRELGIAEMATHTVSAEGMLELLAGDSPEHAGKLSTMYHNRGVDKISGNDLTEGIADLEKALEFEPASETTRNMLGQALALEANRLAELGRVTEARRLLARAEQLNPGDDEIKLARLMMELLMTGKGS